MDAIPTTTTTCRRITVASRNPVKIAATLQGFRSMFPAKLDGVHNPPPTVTGISVPSGVPDQPFTDAETLRGAMNRARNARKEVPDSDYWVGIEGGVEMEEENEDEDDEDGEQQIMRMKSFAWVVVMGHHRAVTRKRKEEKTVLLHDGNDLRDHRTGGAGGGVQKKAGQEEEEEEEEEEDGVLPEKKKVNVLKVGKARTATFYQPDEVARLVRSGMELGAADDQVFGRTNSKQANGSVGLLTGDVLGREGYYMQAVILALIPFRNDGLTF